jgi:hypothetical protein
MPQEKRGGANGRLALIRENKTIPGVDKTVKMYDLTPCAFGTPPGSRKEYSPACLVDETKLLPDFANRRRKIEQLGFDYGLFYRQRH